MCRRFDSVPVHQIRHFLTRVLGAANSLLTLFVSSRAPQALAARPTPGVRFAASPPTPCQVLPPGAPILPDPAGGVNPANVRTDDRHLVEKSWLFRNFFL